MQEMTWHNIRSEEFIRMKPMVSMILIGQLKILQKPGKKIISLHCISQGLFIVIRRTLLITIWIKLCLILNHPLQRNLPMESIRLQKFTLIVKINIMICKRAWNICRNLPMMEMIWRSMLLDRYMRTGYWKCMILTKQLKIILMQQIRKISLRSTGLETYMQIRRTKNNMIWIKHQNILKTL